MRNKTWNRENCALYAILDGQSELINVPTKYKFMTTCLKYIIFLGDLEMRIINLK